MSLFGSTLNYRRYRICQPLPEDFRERYLESIQRFAHQENLKSRSKEPIFGWTSVFDADDTNFDLNKVVYDHYLTLGLRMDKKSLNGKLFSILLERRFKQVMEEQGSSRLGRNHKDEIKEALEEQLLSETLPGVGVHDLAWDLNTNEVLFFGTSDSLNEYLRGLFHDTFQLRLYPDRMVDWLAASLSWEEIEQRAQAFLPGGSSAGGQAASVNDEGWHEDDPISGRELLLGTEFLTWLWHQSELRDGQFLRGEDVQQQFWLETKMVFKVLGENDTTSASTALMGEAPSTTPEAQMAYGQGKRPVEARIGLRRGDYEWSFTLKALPEGLDMSGLKIPAMVKDGEEEMIYERMYLIEVVTEAVRKLFVQFFRERTSEGWKGE